jgi:rod shape-determining protein MreC
MEYSPPPLFKQGAPARVKMTLFACISIALLLADARMNALKTVRQVVGAVLYPLQMVALLPRDAIYGVGDYFSSLSSLEKQVRELKQQQIASAQALQQAQLYNAENAQLRKLLDARERVPGKSLMAEILYDARDSSSRKIVLDRGIQQGVQLGLPVIDNQGVVGQVTRVFPFTSEVTLLTDKEQAIPVQVLRSGLRSVAYGRGQSGQLELRFVAAQQTDNVVVGDILITSGIDGVYPAGLAVARVTQVESNANGVFGRVVCQPLSGIQSHSQLLILMSPPELPARPPEEEPFKPGKKSKAKDMAKEAAGAGAPAATAGAQHGAAAGTAPAARQPAAGTPAVTPGATPAAAPATARGTAPTPAQPAAAQAAPPQRAAAPAGTAAARPGATHGAANDTQTR